MAQEGFVLSLRYGDKRFADASKGLEVLANDLGQSLAAAGQVLALEVQRFLDEVRRALVRRHSARWRAGGSPPDALYRRRGGIQDIQVIVDANRNLNDVVGKLIVPFPISVHEDGARIVARRAQYLTIPLPAALDSRGIPIHPRARDWPNTFVQKSRRGNLIIFQRQGAAIVPLYVLKREVTLPPRLGVEDTFAAGADYFVDTAVDAIAKAIMKGLA